MFKRFLDWVRADVFQHLFDAVLVRFVLLPGQRIPVGVAPLIEDIEFGGLIADKAFDSNWIIQDLSERGAQIVISQRPQRCQPLGIDAEIYKWRHLMMKASRP